MGDSPSVPPSQCRATRLKGQLEKVREARLQAAGHRNSAPEYQPLFFPLDAIKEVLNREQVRSVLECPCEWCEKIANYTPKLMGYENGTTYVDFIMKRALRLFALLVHVGLSALISRFVKTDDHILNEELDRERLKKTYLGGIDSLTAVPAQVLDGLLDAFLNGRHEFNPPVFDGGWLEQWDEKKALPFINTEFVGEGSYGRVYSFQIYPGYGTPELEPPVSSHTSGALPVQSGTDGVTHPDAVGHEGGALGWRIFERRSGDSHEDSGGARRGEAYHQGAENIRSRG